MKACFLGSNLTVPVTDGRIHLGTWQGIWLCEHRDRAGSRKVTVTVNGCLREGLPITQIRRTQPREHHTYQQHGRGYRDQDLEMLSDPDEDTPSDHRVDRRSQNREVNAARTPMSPSSPLQGSTNSSWDRVVRCEVHRYPKQKASNNKIGWKSAWKKAINRKKGQKSCQNWERKKIPKTRLDIHV